LILKVQTITPLENDKQELRNAMLRATCGTELREDCDEDLHNAQDSTPRRGHEANKSLAGAAGFSFRLGRARMTIMRVRVLFFGQLKEITGLAQDDAELSDGARVEDLFERYGRRFPKLAAFRPSVAASVNQEYAAWRAPLSSGDEVAFLPPVSGGQQADVEQDIFQLVREPIRPNEIVGGLKAPEDGALVVFDGFVRNNFKGQQTSHLEYEAYESMAYAKMREIGAEIRAKFPVHRVAIVHRLGRLEIGETSVWIAVSSPHRGAAFDACRYAIDTLKRSVPIWKKEYFAGGAVWAEGETPSQKAILGPDESTSR
jgi:molybdopterin converting factor subunit 1